MANLNDFVNRLAGGGARANQYQVHITGPSFMGSLGATGTASNNIVFLCRTSALPAMTVGEVPLFYRGRQVYFAGDRTYADWTVTVFNDDKWVIRGAMEQWQDQLQNIGSITNGAAFPLGAGAGDGYYGQADVVQMDRNGNKIRTARLYQCWPTNVAEIALAYDTVDAVEEFDVTFRFNHMSMITEAAAADLPSIGIP